MAQIAVLIAALLSSQAAYPVGLQQLLQLPLEQLLRLEILPSAPRLTPGQSTAPGSPAWSRS